VRRRPRLLLVLDERRLVELFAEPLRRLADDGIELRNAVPGAAGPPAGPERGLLAHEGVTLVELRRPPESAVRLFARRLRQLEDILRYVHPDYGGDPSLREAALRRAPPRIRRRAERLLARDAQLRARLWIALAAALDERLPSAPEVRALLDAQQPDAVAVASPFAWASTAVDHLREASRRGLPSAALPCSFDDAVVNGHLHVHPDRLLAWNAAQRAEVVRYHGMSSDRVVVVGAPGFDLPPEGESPVSRAAFLESLGLDPERPLVLYLGSSRSVAPNEPLVVDRWLDALRAHEDKLLAEAAVLVRPDPSPEAIRAWLAHGLRPRAQVAVSLPQGAGEGSAETGRGQLRDAVRHAAAVVGIRTAAMVDAAIAGAPVYGLEDAVGGVESPFLLRQLADPERGLLQHADSLDAHLEQLVRALHRPRRPDPRSAAFVAAFVRPPGGDPAGAFVDAVRDLLALRCPPRPGHPLAGRLLASSSRLLAVPLDEDPLQRLVVLGRLSWLTLGFRLDARRAVWSKGLRRGSKRLRKRSRRAARPVTRAGARLARRSGVRALRRSALVRRFRG
jgi:hypothetical protein